MRTIAVLNQKGGVGKTTTVANTAAALTAVGLNVVVIDLDPQAHLTIHLGVEPQTVEAGSYEVLTRSADFEKSLMLVRHNLWLLAADINLVGAETELVSVVGREIILREALAASRDKFDCCLIDCAPSLGLLSLNALAAAEEVLIPLQPHFLALQGFGKLLQTVDLVNKRINPGLKVTGVLLCMFDTRASLPSEVRADIERFLESARGSASAWAEARVFPTFIRRNIKLAEAPSYGQTIFEYDPTCNGAQDYRRFARYLLGLDPDPEPETQADSAAEPEPVPEAPADPAAATEFEPQATPGVPAATEFEPEAQADAPTATEFDPEARADAPATAEFDPEARADFAPEPNVDSPNQGEAPTGDYGFTTPESTNPQSEIPNPQSPMENPQSPIENLKSEIENPPSQPPREDQPQQPPFEIRSIDLPGPHRHDPDPAWIHPDPDSSDPANDPDSDTSPDHPTTP